MDAAAEAIASQTSAGYYADTWINVVLQPMTKVWQGIGGYSDFFVSEEDAREARGAYMDSEPYHFAETLWRMAQVKASQSHGFRLGIREYVVDLPTTAACGICMANVALGSGSVFQYYIPNWKATLFETGREHKFRGKGY